MFTLMSGRSAVRLARLLREQEVAGSNPVAPTTFNMHSSESYPVPFVLASAALVLLLGCSPSPKYRGSPRAGGEKRVETARSPEKTTQAPVAFGAPVRDYRPGRITSRYGIRRHSRYGTKEFHHGIDITARMGEDVLASAPGTVIFAGRQSGYGKVIIIDHGSRFCTVSAHLSSIQVKEGDAVSRGDVIGKVGRSGNATGVHVHFEIRIAGKSTDPLKYISVHAGL
jgi:murein DD-endopeptidase MepM/ murein hydrolase activator NlpD